MTKIVSKMNTSVRLHSNFEDKVRRAFSFLTDLDFSEVEALPTIVRYQKGNVEVDIYHGRQSYEIGLGVTAFGTRYGISEIIRIEDNKAANQFRYVASTTEKGVDNGLEELSSILKQYGYSALAGDPNFYSILDRHRKSWSEDYALDVLAEQLRPQANEAFRHKNYLLAAELYSRIKERLSKSEVKKLSVAKERCKKQ